MTGVGVVGGLVVLLLGGGSAPMGANLSSVRARDSGAGSTAGIATTMPPPTTTTVMRPPQKVAVPSTSTVAARPLSTTTSTSLGNAAAAGSASASVPNACGGQSTLVVDGIRWTCSFDSEFSGTTLDATKWSPLLTATSGYVSGAACYVDTPKNIAVGNGYLSLTVRKEPAPFICSSIKGDFATQYTSGSVMTYKKFSQTYGRFEVLAKVPAATVAGLQSSLWMFPESLDGYGKWPASGEIDIAETFSEYPGLAVPNFHYNFDYTTRNTATDTNVVTNTTCKIDDLQFNDYVLEWTPTTLKVLINGATCLVDHWIPAPPQIAPQPFDQPFFMILTQALGIETNEFNPATTPLPATTEIKYVRAWTGAF